MRGKPLFPTFFPVRGFIWALVAILGVCQHSTQADDAAKAEFFESKIRPVLVQHCYECHSADSKSIKGGLQLDTAESLLRGGDSGPGLVAGRSPESLLVEALKYQSLQMPPKGKLPDSVVHDFEQWVDSGAYDPRTGGPAPERPAIDFAEARKFWSYREPLRPARPDVRDGAWPKSEIDYFTLSAMESRQLKPVAAAGKRELIRRATFDLLGLPPTPEEIEAFLADDSPDAFARVVDRLLQSPHYGERWGRYWLDVARYSEDQAHTFSVTPNTSGYQYRDWVVSAFNADMPFDQFVKFQIAGDLLDLPENERLRHLAALGYFGLGAQYYKNTDAAKAAADELDDRVDTLTRGFLGLTVSCARCHDHKFDPIPQQDYYSLAGIFQSSRLHNAPLVPQAEVDAWNASQQRLKELDETVKGLVTGKAPALREARLVDVSRYMLAAWKFDMRRQRGASESIAAVAEAEQLDAKFLERWVTFLSPEQRDKLAALKAWNAAVAETDSVTANDSGNQDVPEGLRVASGGFQNLLDRLLRRRDGKLTAQEEAELSQSIGPGNARYMSPLMTKREGIAKIDLDITGARELHLVVTDGGNGASCDHADWAEPWVITAEGETRLTELNWRTATATFGSINRDRNVNGGRLRIAGKPYEFGLGTHSTSVIVYDLPAGATRFRALVGLDNSGTDQGGCGDGAAVQFRVYTETPTDIQVGAPDLLTLVFGEQGLFAIEPADVEKYLTEADRSTLNARRQELEALRKSAPAMYPVAHVIAESTPSDMRVFVRGNPANQGDAAPRRFLKVLAGDDPPRFEQGSGRRELAEAMAPGRNPLTARVMVNRLWQHHFGRGIVGTPDNFGKLGESPTHPELLDYLAIRFAETGWSIKAMHRDLMLSSTWQLSSATDEGNLAIDGDNRYLWRSNRQRLDIEAWRDALLSVSGRLDASLKGPSTNLADAGNNRRTVYAFISRHELDNMLRLFDFPDANITSSTRTETTVPQQQLFVINSAFMLEQARSFSSRLIREVPEGDEARIRRAFLLAFGRPETPEELELGLSYLQQDDSVEEQQGTSLSRWERYAQVLLGSNEFMYLD